MKSMSSLQKKLRLAAGQRMLLINAPDTYCSVLEPLPEGTSLGSVDEPPSEVSEPADFVHLFVRNRAELDAFIDSALRFRPADRVGT
jgi:hypothetical protein